MTRGTGEVAAVDHAESMAGAADARVVSRADKRVELILSRLLIANVAYYAGVSR